MNAPADVCKACRGRRFTGLHRRVRCKACNPAPPKAKGARSATHQGECGLCERSFTVDVTAKTLAFHGFNRPGDGYTVGRCPGTDHEPVELSPKTIEMLREYATQRAEHATQALATYQDPALAELRYTITKRTGTGFARQKEFETIIVKRGDKQRLHDTWWIPSFDELLVQRIREQQHALKTALELKARAEARIAAWALTELKKI